jgi:flavin reductase (DIM6/NTAB) family NADH-FMN oxidoreductase RutF
MELHAAQADNTRDLRSAFGCFATGVAVATCRDMAGVAVAVTINSFSSVSLVPPLVSFALGSTARCLPSFLGAPRFAIHVLTSTQLSVSSRFARPTGASWEGIGQKMEVDEHVVLDEYTALFLCDHIESRKIGDHIVFLGQVRRFGYDPCSHPLIFCQGRYGTIDFIGPPQPMFDPFELDFRTQLGWG